MELNKSGVFKKKKIAVFHPWIKSRGGAEKVVLEILKNKKFDVDVYTWVYDKDNTFEEFKKFNIKVIGPKVSRGFSRSYLSRGFFLINSLLSKIPVEKYDFFLVSTSGVAEFVLFRNYKPGKTFAFVYTPLRAATKEIVKWNLKNRYKSLLKKFAYLTAVSFYRFLEKKAWKKIDFAMFISDLSLERAKQRKLIDNKKTKIIYVPIDIDKFNKLKLKKGEYFFYPSRFSIDKRQDIFLKAWKIFEKKHPNEKLILAGSVEDKKYFEKIKQLSSESKNVEIKTNVEFKRLLKLYENSKGVVYPPLLEDFGIVPFEALAAGKPVIAVNEGGFVNLIKDIPQVYFIEESTSEKKFIQEIVKKLEEVLKIKKPLKKIKNIGNNAHNFINELDKILS